MNQQQYCPAIAKYYWVSLYLQPGNEQDTNVGSNSNKRHSSRGRQNIVSQEIVTALNRIRFDDRRAIRILMAAAKSLGCGTNEIAINRSTIRRSRILIRQQIADSIKVIIVLCKRMHVKRHFYTG